MADAVFFSKQRKGNEREITLQTYTGLCSRSHEKRLRMSVQMVLGQKVAGYPDWLIKAFEFVVQNHDVVTPDLHLSFFDIEFSQEQNLFGEKSVKMAKCEMKSFQISEVGGSEDPIAVLTFKIYAPFSRKLNDWCGQMNGDEFWAKFIQGEAPEEAQDAEEEQLALTPDAEQGEVDESDEEIGDTEEAEE